MNAIEEGAGRVFRVAGQPRPMKIRRTFRMVALAWGAYRTYRRYRSSVRAGTKRAMKRARRAI